MLRTITYSVYVSSERMTFLVTVDSASKIVEAPPIAKKFIGQHFSNLEKWMKNQGGYRREIIERR